MPRAYTSPYRDKIQAAVTVVKHHIIGTPLDAAEFEMPKGEGAKYDNLAFMAQLRRAWAYGKNKTALVAAFDNLIKAIGR